MSSIDSKFIGARASPHQAEVQAFLQEQFGNHQWEFRLPRGWGKETYFASGGGERYFVKLDAPIANYQAMAFLGLTPPVVAMGILDDGTSVIAQPYIESKTPCKMDFQVHLPQFAAVISTMQHSVELREALPKARSDLHRDLGQDALRQVRRKWDRYKSLVRHTASQVEEKLYQLAAEIDLLDGGGVVPSHNDACNANWLVTSDGKIYLIDLDSMTMDDPACDLGAILWWYYPPDLRPHFLHAAGYINSEQLRNRMHLRMAMHCLDILLPREPSYDRFEADKFEASLEDFRAILAGEENPQGYG